MDPEKQGYMRYRKMKEGREWKKIRAVQDK